MGHLAVAWTDVPRATLRPTAGIVNRALRSATQTEDAPVQLPSSAMSVDCSHWTVTALKNAHSHTLRLRREYVFRATVGVVRLISPLARCAQGR